MEEPSYDSSSPMSMQKMNTNVSGRQLVDASNPPSNPGQIYENPLQKQYSYQGRSPIKKEKGGKLGAIYNPNSLDPHRVPMDPAHNMIAGVATNYGVQAQQGPVNQVKV